MLVRSAPDLKDCDVTDQALYLRRREFIAGGTALGAGLAAGAADAQTALKFTPNRTPIDEKATPLKDITGYNNFYEFGVNKDDPAANAKSLRPRPWTVVVDGLCNKPGRYAIDDLIKLAREKPGALSYRSYGTGGGGHIIGVGLNRAANTQMIHVPYKGEAASFPDLISGQITAAFGSTGFYTPHVAAGKVRLLAVASPMRLKRFPNVPTFAEAGYPGVNLPGWTGVFLPAGTPPAIVNKFSQEIRNALVMPDVQNRLLDFGYEPNGTTPEEFAQYIKAEVPRWSSVIKENNIKLE